MSEKIKQRCLFPALAHHSPGALWVCGSSSPGQPFYLDWAGADQAPGEMAQTVPDILLSLSKGWIISVSALQAAQTDSSSALTRVNPGFVALLHTLRVWRFYLSHFFSRWGRSVGTISHLSFVCIRRISCWKCWRGVWLCFLPGRPWLLSV